MVSGMKPEDYIKSEFSVFYDKFIRPVLGSESDKRVFIVSHTTPIIINTEGNFYSMGFQVSGKLGYLKYRVGVNLKIPTMLVNTGNVKLSKIFEDIFSTANYIVFSVNDERFVEWARNSGAKMVINFNYYIINDEVYGSSEVGVYKNNNLVVSVGVLNNKNDFYPAYLKINESFLRLKPKTQALILKKSILGLLNMRNVGKYIIRGFDDKLQSDIITSQIISELTREIIPRIVNAGKEAFIDRSKPIIIAYKLENGEVKKVFKNLKQ